MYKVSRPEIDGFIPMDIILEFPFYINVVSYYEFEEKRIFLSSIINHEVKYKELGMEGPYYCAIFYLPEIEEDLNKRGLLESFDEMEHVE